MSVSARKLTARLASDVTNVARKISNAPHSPSTLDLFNDISDIYPLSSPTLFHKTLDVLLLVSCTYLVRICSLGISFYFMHAFVRTYVAAITRSPTLPPTGRTHACSWGGHVSCIVSNTGSAKLCHRWLLLAT